MTTTIPPPPPAPDTEEIPPTDPAPATLAPARVPSLPDWPSEAVTAVECPHPHPTTDPTPTHSPTREP